MERGEGEEHPLYEGTYSVNVVDFIMPERHKVDDVRVLHFGQFLQDLDQAILIDKSEHMSGHMQIILTHTACMYTYIIALHIH